MTIDGSVATLQFEGTGPSETITVQDFTCRLDEIVNGGFVAVTGSDLCTAIPGMLQKLTSGLLFLTVSLSYFHLQELVVLHTQ